VLYSAHVAAHERAHTAEQERGTADAMRTSEVFWKLFATTGSVRAYLMYRHLNPSPTG